MVCGLTAAGRGRVTVDLRIEVVDRLGDTCDVWIASEGGGMRVLLAQNESKITALKSAQDWLDKFGVVIENELDAIGAFVK